MSDVTKDLLDALKMATLQNRLDMMMTGDEIRKCEAAIARAEAALAAPQPDASMTRASRETALEQARAEEREACAKLCDSLVHPSAMTNDPGSMWIRGTTDCAAAIRRHPRQRLQGGELTMAIHISIPVFQTPASNIKDPVKMYGSIIEAFKEWTK